MSAAVRGGSPVVASGGSTPVAAWSAANKSTHIVLSGSNLIATTDTTANQLNGLSDTAITVLQKIYFEIVCTTLSGAGAGFTALGFGNASTSLTDGAFLGGDANSVGYYASGPLFVSGANTGSIATYTTGDVLGFAIDGPHGKGWVRKGAGGWLNDVIGNQNPATNTGGFTLPAGSLFAAYDMAGNAAVGVSAAQFKTFSNAAPAGFSAYSG